MERSDLVKKMAEEFAVDLLANDMQSNDPALSAAGEKLRPFKERLGQVSPELIRNGLEMVSADLLLDDDAAAKKCLVDLVDKLWDMRSLFGVL